MYGKKDEFLVGDTKILEVNQKDKLEDNQPEHVNSEIGFYFGSSSIWEDI